MPNRIENVMRLKWPDPVTQVCSQDVRRCLENRIFLTGVHSLYGMLSVERDQMVCSGVTTATDTTVL